MLVRSLISKLCQLELSLDIEWHVLTLYTSVFGGQFHVSRDYSLIDRREMGRNFSLIHG